MTDDLEAMGVERTPGERRYAAERTSGVAAYEDLLRQYLAEHQKEIPFGVPVFPDGLPGTVVDAHTAVLRIRPESEQELSLVGNFLSGVYQSTSDAVITYELPFPLQYLCSIFPTGKVFVNQGTIGGYFGQDSYSTVVNSGVIHPIRSLFSRVAPAYKGLLINRAPLTDHYPESARCYVDTLRGIVKGTVPRRFRQVHGHSVLVDYELSLSPNRFPSFWLSQPIEPFTGALIFEFYDDAKDQLTGWLSEIDRVASREPETLLTRYGRTLAEDPKSKVRYEKTYRVLQYELFNLLFKPRGAQ